MKQKIILSIVLICLISFVGLVSAEPSQVTVKGRIVSLYSNSPVPEMDIAVWDGSEMKQNIGKTNSDGTFSVTFDMNKAKQSDRGDSQSNYYYRLTKDCYVGPDILIQNLGSYWVVSVPYIHKNIANAIRAESSNIDVGDVPINSMANFKLSSDIEVKSSHSWKNLNQKYISEWGGDKWVAGSYDNVFRTSRENQQYIPFDSYVRFRLLDDDGNVYVSPIYYVPLEECKTMNLNFNNGQFSSNLDVAQGVIEGPFEDGGINLPVKKGWNLLPFSAMDPLSRSQIQPETFRVSYLYITPLNDYLKILSNEMSSRNILNTKLQEKGKDENWLRQNINSFYNLGGWFYSDKDGEVTLKFGEANVPFDMLELSQGWNFKTITPDLRGKSYSDIKGSCNIEKVASWNENSQNWNVLTYDEIKNDEFDNFIYEVRVIKVSSDCKLGKGDVGQPPPQMPN